MSGTPKYTTVSLSERRAAEARAAVEAARRQLEAEAAQRRAAAERERIERLREREAAMVERHRANVEKMRQAMVRPAVADATPQARTAPQQRRGARTQAAEAVPDAIVSQGAPPAFTQAAPPAFNPVVAPVPEPQYVEPEPVVPEPEPLPQLSAEVAATMLDLRAEAEALLAVLAGQDTLQAAHDQLAEADRRLTAALEAEDEAGAAAVIEGLRAALNTARQAHDEFAELRARRRIIATALAASLPDRYVVDPNLVEFADGAIRFSAAAPGEELRVAVMDDGKGGEVIGYQTDGAEIVESTENGEVVTDCPDLAASLEAAHDRLREQGIDAGPLHWRHAPEHRRRAVPSKTKTKVHQR